jgi:hypothetical protein
VWYLDKTRMEITHPDGDPDSAWYVTTGLLVKEMISGKMQLGDTQFEPRQPAAVPVTGDMDAAPGKTITYADLRPLASLDGERRVPKATNDASIIDVVQPRGQVTQDPHLADYDIRPGGYDDVVGHNVAAVFLHAISNDRLLYLAGRPLTEPYWTHVPVGHQEKDVLVQAFERRVLTYTPSNPAPWKVEWGNVGRQYVQWRYGRINQTEASPASNSVSITLQAGNATTLATCLNLVRQGNNSTTVATNACTNTAVARGGDLILRNVRIIVVQTNSGSGGADAPSNSVSVTLLAGNATALATCLNLVRQGNGSTAVSTNTCTNTPVAQGGNVILRNVRIVTVQEASGNSPSEKDQDF